MNQHTDRCGALGAVLALTGDLEAALDALEQLAPSTDQRSVLVDRSMVGRALDAFVRGDLSAALLERWAEALHSAEDVELDPDDRDHLSAALFELSTPELFGSMETIVANLQIRNRPHET